MKRYVKVLATGALLGIQGLPGYVSVAGAQNAQLPPSSTYVPMGYSNSGLGFYSSSYSGGGSLSGGPPEAEAFGVASAPPPPAPKPDRERIARCESDFAIASTRASSAYTQDIKFCSDIVMNGKTSSGTSDWASANYASCRNQADARLTKADNAAKAERSNCLAGAGANGG